MAKPKLFFFEAMQAPFQGRSPLAWIPADALTVVLAAVVGLLGGYGAAVFTLLIDGVNWLSVEAILAWSRESPLGLAALCASPALGLLLVSWMTRRFAPEAEGHGVPEVITAVARRDGVIRPRVALVKILASGLTIGTGGSVGREGPIVQIGSTLGSVAGQWCKLSPRHIKVLVAAGAAAGISATFNAPLAGVVFASEIIIGSFAVESLTPIVVASVVADVVQYQVGEHGLDAAFPHLDYRYEGAWSQLPSYVLLGLACGLAAVAFTKLLYATEDFGRRWMPRWWVRPLVFGGMVGLAGVLYPFTPPSHAPGGAPSTGVHTAEREEPRPPLFGVGYDVVSHALHLENADKAKDIEAGRLAPPERADLVLTRGQMWSELLWLLPLALLKPIMTSVTLGGGGSGGIFAPSLFLGAALGGSFGLLCNLIVPQWSANPGVYAIVGMAAVVAGTTHGILSATLIVYEMTGDYHVILPIMAAAGLSSMLAQVIDPESIYYKKLSRRGEVLARGHDLHRLEHVMVRDVMVRHFPSVNNNDAVAEIVRVARANPHFESLPVMDADGQLLGIIRPEDLHRVLDSDIPPHLVNAEDICLTTPISATPDENLLEALRDFGTRDVETLPVEEGRGPTRRLVGLLLRSDVMRRYRQELLRH